MREWVSVPYESDTGPLERFAAEHDKVQVGWVAPAGKVYYGAWMQVPPGVAELGNAYEMCRMQAKRSKDLRPEMTPFLVAFTEQIGFAKTAEQLFEEKRDEA